MQLPTRGSRAESQPELDDRLTVMLGGRVAEELVFGQVTTGAQNDLERATQIARHMVYEFGMSDRLGPMSYGRRESLFLGDGLLNRPQAASEATNEAIDAEVATLVRGAHATARQMLSERRAGLVGLARTLEREETLEADKLRDALAEARIRDADRDREPPRGEPLVA